MAEADRTAWAKEVQRAEKAAAHRRERIKVLEGEINDLEVTITYLNAKIAKDYEEDR